MKLLFPLFAFLFGFQGNLYGVSCLSISCPGSATVNCTDAYDTALTGYPVVSNLCGGETEISFQDDMTAFCLSPAIESSVVRTWTIQNGYGESASCSQTLFLQPIHISGFSAPPTITVGCGEGTDPSVTGDLLYNGVPFYGNCVVGISTEDLVSQVNCSQQKIIRTWQVIAWCAYPAGVFLGEQVIFVEKQPITCPSDITVDCGGPVFWEVPTACSPDDEIQSTHSPGMSFAEGITTVTYTLTNECGSSSCSFSVTVQNTWYKDADNDGWSDGTTLTQCAQPPGFKLASNLLGTSGDCADGLGQVSGFPNNSRANIYPGAPELCNGIDDNCDGTIDEGLSGYTYPGNLTFTNQFELNNFPSCYTAISGKLTLQGLGITDLSPLANLAAVGGELKLFNTAVADLSPLQNLTQLGRLTIQHNGFLTTLSGLSPTLTIDGNLRIMQNINLSDCCAIEHFLLYGGVSGIILIHQNDTGCNNQNEVLTSCPLFAPPPSPQQAGYEENWSSEESAISIYPNPTMGALHISLSAENAHIQVFNSLGQLMLERQAAGGTERLDLSRLVDGVYWVRVLTEGGTGAFTEQVILDRK